MKNATYLIIGLVMGYFMAIIGTQNLKANSFKLGTKFNPMYVKITQ